MTGNGGGFDTPSCAAMTRAVFPVTRPYRIRTSPRYAIGVSDHDHSIRTSWRDATSRGTSLVGEPQIRTTRSVRDTDIQQPEISRGSTSWTRTRVTRTRRWTAVPVGILASAVTASGWAQVPVLNPAVRTAETSPWNVSRPLL